MSRLKVNIPPYLLYINFGGIETLVLQESYFLSIKVQRKDVKDIKKNYVCGDECTLFHSLAGVEQIKLKNVWQLKNHVIYHFSS